MAKHAITPHLPDDTEESQVRMGFGEHLEELRKRLISAMLGSILFVVVGIYYMKDILAIIVRPYQLALEAHGYPYFLAYSKPQEGFLTTFSIAIKAGLVVASPWIIYQLWLFIAAGLYKRERRIVYKYIGPSALLFLLGVAFFYFLVLPLTLNFFIGFNDNTAVSSPRPNRLETLIMGNPAPAGVTAAAPASASATMPAATTLAAATAPALPLPEIPILNGDAPKPPSGQGYLYFDTSLGQLKFRAGDATWILLVAKEGAVFVNLPQLGDYLDFVVFTALIFGGAFEMPMVILILAQVNIVKVSTFRSIRKYAYFVISIVSAVAAPSADVLTMLCLMVPLIALYEAGVIAASIATRHRREDDEPTVSA